MDGSSLDEETLETLRRELAEHGVSFALLFGSGARGSMDEHSDVDVAIEFADRRPTDAGYSDAYLRLRSALAESLPTAVDLVDVHSMGPRFASVALEEGTVILGTEARRMALRERYGGESVSLAEARERVAAAAERLREGTS